MVNFLYDRRTSNNWLQFLPKIPAASKDWNRGNTVALRRQTETVQLIIQAYQKKQPGLIIADDVGLGKTWVGVLAAIAWASNGKKVLIVTPNRTLRDKWFDEFCAWYGSKPNPALWIRSDTEEDWEQQHPGNSIKWGRFDVEYKNLAEHKILIVTSSNFKGREEWNTNLLIVDEAHRGKGEGGFIEMIRDRTPSADFRLLLTATPFGKDVATLGKMLQAVGADTNDCNGGDNKNVFAQLKCAREMLCGERFLDPDRFDAAIQSLRPWIIRHTLETLPLAEKRRIGRAHHVFGSLISPQDVDDRVQREIPSIRIEDSRIKHLILHAERLKQLCPEQLGGVETLVAPYSQSGLEKIAKDIKNSLSLNRPINSESNQFCHRPLTNPGVVDYHAERIIEITSSLNGKGPMEQALCEFAITCFKQCEKLIVFCYHHQVVDTLHEVLRCAAKKAELVYDKPNDDLIKSAFEAQSRANICQNEEADEKYMECAIDTFSGDHFRYLKQYEQQSNGIISKSLEDLFVGMSIKKRKFSSGQPMEIVESLKDAEGNRGAMIHRFFNSPFFPMALVATTKDSEGIDLHRYCRIVVHYELCYRPETLLQANGRVRRVGSWAGQIGKPVLYYYPYLEGTRSEALTKEVVKRVERFGHMMGGVPDVTPDSLAAAVATRTKGAPEPEMPELDFTNGGFCKVLHLGRNPKRHSVIV